MIKFKRVPDRIKAKYESWKSDTTYGRKNWIERAVESEELYLNDVDNTGTTFTSSQYSHIQDATNIPVSINMLYPTANQKLAMLAQVKPSTRTVSLDGRAKQEAQVLDKMKTGLFYSSDARMEIENHIKDMLISGMGAVMITPGDFYRPGLFGLQLSHIPYDEFILDINAKKRDLDDMEGFFVEKQFTIPKTLQLYGKVLSELKDEAGEPVPVETFTGVVWVEQGMTDKAKVTTTNWDSGNRVVAREYYEKVYTTMYSIKNPKTGLTEFFFAENVGESPEFLAAQAQDTIPDIYIKKTVILGDFEIYEEILPINNYPLIVSFFEWGGKPYRSYGMIHYTKDMQKAFDKVLHIMLLNGILSNNAGWTAPKGAIAEEDRKKWEDYGNNPRVIKEYVAQEINGVLLKPEKERVTPLSNFYPLVLDMMKQGVEYSTGITAIVQGNAQEAGVDVFSSLQQYQQSAMQRILLSVNHINDTMKNLGEVIIQYLIASIKPNSFQFFDEKGHLNELTIAVGLANKIKQFKYQVIAIPSTYMPTQQLASAMELMKIAQSSPDPAERSILTQKAMEMSEVKGYDEVEEKLDLTKRTQQQLEQLKTAYDRLMETSKQMENKFINISLENRILKKLSQSEKELTTATESAKAEVKIAKELKKGQIQPKQTK